MTTRRVEQRSSRETRQASASPVDGTYESSETAVTATAAACGARPSLRTVSRRDLSAEVESLRWRRQIGFAQRTWERIGDDELVRSAGRRSELARLVAERHGVSPAAADLQVRRFLQLHAHLARGSRP